MTKPTPGATTSPVTVKMMSSEDKRKKKMEEGRRKKVRMSATPTFSQVIDVNTHTQKC